MMKRVLTMLLALLLLCPCTQAAGDSFGLDNAYQEAAAMMVGGDPAGASQAFYALSGYRDAPQMAIYCQGLAWRQKGQHALAAQTFALIPGFKDADVQKQLSLGLAEQAEADAAAAQGPLEGIRVERQHLQAALEYYEPLLCLAEVDELAAVCHDRLAALDTRVWDDIKAGEDGLCIVTRDGLQGVINAGGEIVLPCEWKAVYGASSGLAAVENEHGLGVISFSGEVLLSFDGERVYCGTDNWQFYSGKDEKGKRSAANVTLDRGVITRWDGTVLYTDTGWQTILDGKGFGLLDPQGRQIVPCEYRDILLREDLGVIAAMRTSKTMDYFDLSGNRLQLEASERLMLEELWVGPGDKRLDTGFAYLYEENGRCSRVRSLSGDFLFEAPGDIHVFAVDSAPGLYLAYEDWFEDGRYRYAICLLDASGKVLVRTEDVTEAAFEDQRYLLVTNFGNLFRIYDMQEETCVELPLVMNEEFYFDYLGDGLLKTSDGFVYDMQGRAVVSPADMRVREYDAGLFFYENHAGKHGVMDAEGRDVIPAVYSRMMIEDGLIWYSNDDDLWGLMDYEGAEILPAIYSNVEINSGMVLVKSVDGLYGVMDRTGKEVLPAAYKRVQFVGEMILATLPDGSGVLTDRQGTVLQTTLQTDKVEISDGCVFILRDSVLVSFGPNPDEH